MRLLRKAGVGPGTILDARRAVAQARALLVSGATLDAADTLEAAVRIGHDLDWPWARWSLGLRTAELRLRGGDPAEAAAGIHRLQASPEAAADPARATDAFLLLGMAGIDAGAWPSALEAFEQARAAADRLRPADDPKEAEDGSVLVSGLESELEAAYALALHRVGRYARALQHYEVAEKAIALIEQAVEREEGKAHGARWAVSLANCRSNVGALWLEIGQPDHALAKYRTSEADFRRALAVVEASPEAGLDPAHVATGLAIAIANQAEVHAIEGDLARAREKTREAVRRFDEAGESRYAVETLAFLADGEAAAGRPAEAAATYEDMRRRATAARDVAGEAHARLGRAEARLALARAAGFLVDERPAPRDAPPTVARLLPRAGARGARRELLEARALASRAGGPELRARILTATAETCNEAGDLPEALAAAADAVREVERATSSIEAADEVKAMARGRHGAAWVQGTRAALATGAVETAVHFVEGSRANALLHALGGPTAVEMALVPPGLRASVAEAVARRAQARADLEVALSDLDAEHGREKAQAARTRVEEAEARCKVLEDRLRAHEGRRSDLVALAPAPISEVRRHLQQGDAFVWYATLGDEAAALVGEPGGERAVRLGSLDRIARACDALRESVDVDEWPALADEVARLVVEPLGLDKGVTRIVVSPQGPLAWVPWRAVLDRGRPATDIVLVPSAAVYARLRASPAADGRGVLALGGCDYETLYDSHAIAVHVRGRPFSALPASGPEAKAIASEPGDEVLLGARATVSGLRERLAARTHRLRAVHLACHGDIHDADPMLSALALTATTSDDGLLRASDVVGMTIDADLAVLSACSTGLDREVPGEGFFGLTRAFMVAGAPRVLVSLWKMDDEATAALMRAFYGRFRAGTGAARALREAQAETAAKERWRHPRYWAGWVVWGLPD
ncbi:MAG TPA: CHAT domain-containing protein [Planctomycetota bacterium]|nr:CHAT domain-containing protein [Planctomycetota bacterium]